MNRFPVADTILGHIERVFMDTSYVPKYVFVEERLYHNLLVELASTSDYRYGHVGYVNLIIQTVCGEVRVSIDKDMPEGMNFYLDDGQEEKMKWLDRIAEEILLTEIQ